MGKVNFDRIDVALAYSRKGRIAASPKNIIMTAIGFFLVAWLTPVAMTSITGANTTGWDATVKTIFQTLFPILYIIGAAILFIPY